MILLDTDVAVDVLRRFPPAVEWVDRAIGDQQFVLPGFVSIELIAGTTDRRSLADTYQFIGKCRVVWLNRRGCTDAAETFRQIHLQNAIGITDILIGHVALHYRLPLYTFNTKHYTAIPGLQTIQPYLR